MCMVGGKLYLINEIWFFSAEIQTEVNTKVQI